jgi:hemolysin activation/secretion protein
MDSRIARHVLIVLALAALAPAPLLAQVYDHVAPKAPAPVPPPVATPPPVHAPLVSPSSGEVLAPELKGLVFVYGVENLKTDGLAPGAAGSGPIAVENVPTLDAPAFAARMRPFIGHPLTTDGVALIRAEAKAYLTAHGRPYVEVTAPPQNVSSGIVQLVVTEYRLGRIIVQPGRYFSKAVVEAPNELKPGETLTLQAVQADVDRLNENPFLSVDAVFKPGEEPGTTDMDLIAKDRLPLRVYAGYDNQGYPLLGLQEFSAGINWGNAFGDGQILSYQYTRSFTGRFSSHSASDVIPVTGNDKVLIFGNYETLQPDIGPDFNNVGHSGQISFRIVHAFPSLSWLSGHIQIGYDFKYTNNNLAFFGTTVLNNGLEVDQFPIVLDASETDRLGQTAFENDLIISPGGLTGDNNDISIQGLVPGGTSRYVYDRPSITRTTRLPWNLSWVARFAGQTSTGILPDSEQLGGGGVGSVRGYFTDTALGSVGALTNQEIRLPAFSPSALVNKNSSLGDLAQLGGFFDAGEFRQPEAIAGGARTANLASAGVHAHYSIGRRFDINFDMGWQLRPAPGETNLGYYGAIALSVAY